MRRLFLCSVICVMLCHAVGCSSLAESDGGQAVISSETTEIVTEEMESSETGESIPPVVKESADTLNTESAETTDGSIDTVETAEESVETLTEQQGGNAALAGQAELVEISPDNVFVDYRFVNGYEGIYAPDECGDGLGVAVLAFKQTQEYLNAAAALSSGKPLVGADTQRNDAPDVVNEYVHDFYEEVEGGEYNPIFHCAYIDDFDNDGREEQFILLKFPYCADYDRADNEHTIWCRYYLIFSDADGNAELLDSFWHIDDITLLDYGTDKQLLFNATAIIGADMHMPLYGVVDGKAVCLYNIRGSYEKWACFLSAYGWQGTGDLMYFDTSAKEYRSITGIVLDKNEVDAMDRSDTLPYEPDEYMEVTLVGGRYYCFRLGAMDYGVVMVYEDGEFLPVADKHIRTANLNDKAVLIDDIDKAIEEMIQPEQASGACGEEIILL